MVFFCEYNESMAYSSCFYEKIGMKTEKNNFVTFSYFAGKAYIIFSLFLLNLLIAM